MAEKLIWRGKAWYYRLTLADGRRVTRKGCTDKRVTEQMAAAAEIQEAKIKSGLVNPKDVAYRDHESRPLADHLDDWHKDLLAKGKTAKHADLSRDRAGKLIAMVKGVRLDDLIPGRKADAMERAARLLADTLARSRFGELTAEMIQTALARLQESGRSSQTANHLGVTTALPLSSFSELPV